MQIIEVIAAGNIKPIEIAVPDNAKVYYVGKDGHRRVLDTRAEDVREELNPFDIEAPDVLKFPTERVAGGSPNASKVNNKPRIASSESEYAPYSSVVSGMNREFEARNRVLEALRNFIKKQSKNLANWPQQAEDALQFVFANRNSNVNFGELLACFCETYNLLNGQCECPRLFTLQPPEPPMSFAQFADYDGGLSETSGASPVGIEPRTSNHRQDSATVKSSSTQSGTV